MQYLISKCIFNNNCVTEDKDDEKKNNTLKSQKQLGQMRLFLPDVQELHRWDWKVCGLFTFLYSSSFTCRASRKSSCWDEREIYISIKYLIEARKTCSCGKTLFLVKPISNQQKEERTNHSLVTNQKSLCAIQT